MPPDESPQWDQGIAEFGKKGALDGQTGGDELIRSHFLEGGHNIS